MAVPDFQTLMLPLLKLVSDEQQHTIVEAVERMAEEFQLSEEDRTQLLKSGQPRLYNRVGWTTTYLNKAGLLRAVGLGRFQLTDRGRGLKHPLISGEGFVEQLAFVWDFFVPPRERAHSNSHFSADADFSRNLLCSASSSDSTIRWSDVDLAYVPVYKARV